MTARAEQWTEAGRRMLARDEPAFRVMVAQAWHAATGAVVAPADFEDPLEFWAYAGQLLAGNERLYAAIESVMAGRVMASA